MAAERIKMFGRKIGPQAYDVVRGLIVDIVSESIKKQLM